MTYIIDCFDTTTGTVIRSESPFYAAGWFPTNPRVGQTATVSANFIALHPFLTGVRTLHVHKLGLAATALNASLGNTGLVGIYASDSTWVPASLIVQADTLNIAAFSSAAVTARIIASSTNAYLTPMGLYWGATLVSTRTNARVEHVTTTPPFLGWNSSLTHPYVGLVASWGFATGLPASFNVASATFTISLAPFVGIIVTQ